jgi:hypothetical protein
MWADAAMIKAKIDEIAAMTPEQLAEQSDSDDDDDLPELVQDEARHESDQGGYVLHPAAAASAADYDDLTIHDIIPPASEEDRIMRQQWLASSKSLQQLNEAKQKALDVLNRAPVSRRSREAAAVAATTPYDLVGDLQWPIVKDLDNQSLQQRDEAKQKALDEMNRIFAERRQRIADQEATKKMMDADKQQHLNRAAAAAASEATKRDIREEGLVSVDQVEWEAAPGGPSPDPKPRENLRDKDEVDLS